MSYIELNKKALFDVIEKNISGKKK